MYASNHSQKQKLILLKPRRFASSASRPTDYLGKIPFRKVGLFSVGIGALTGLGIPIVLAATPPHPAASPQKTQPTSSHASSSTTNVSIENHTSSISEEVFSSDDTPSPPSTTVTINGETIPLTNGFVSRSYADDSGGTANVDVTVNSSNTSNHTDISVSSSSSTASSGQNQERGSP